MTDIERAVNIGPILGAQLRRAGIATLEDLRGLGYIEAWRRLQAVSRARLRPLLPGDRRGDRGNAVDEITSGKAHGNHCAGARKPRPRRASQIHRSGGAMNENGEEIRAGAVTVLGIDNILVRVGNLDSRLWLQVADARRAGIALVSRGWDLLRQPFQTATGWTVEVADPCRSLGQRRRTRRLYPAA